MKLSIGSIISVSIRYIYPRNDTFYYQRKIPKDLIERYNGVRTVKLNLKTQDLTIISKKVHELNRHYESTWDSMRNNSSITPSTIRESAIKLLNQYGLKPLPASNPEINIEHFYDLIVESKRYKIADGDDDVYRNISPQEYLTPVEAEAYKLLLAAPKLLLSEALDIYLNGHQKKNNSTFRTYTERVWKKLIEVLGDVVFESVTRANANEFVENLLANGNKTTTVQRVLSTIKAVFNVVIIEMELGKPNPFLKLRIAGLGTDSVRRNPFSDAELKLLSQACIEADDDMRWLLALQMDLGSRLGEIAGLALDDLKLDAETPHVVIKPHSWRSLKTLSSERNVPLVGMSMWAANRIVAHATRGQIYAFPRYNDGKSTRATAASGALNSWIKSQNVQTTTHGFRHAMRDRLRNVGAPLDIQDAVGGWGKKSTGEKYGHGYGLKTVKRWLSKVVF